MSKQTGWINNLGRVIKSKKGSYFLLMERRKDKNGKYIGEPCYPITINEGDMFQLKLKKDDLQKLVDEGKLSQDAAEEICERVKFEVSKAPPREGAAKSNQSSDEDDGVNF